MNFRKYKNKLVLHEVLHEKYILQLSFFNSYANIWQISYLLFVFLYMSYLHLQLNSQKTILY